MRLLELLPDEEDFILLPLEDELPEEERVLLLGVELLRVLGKLKRVLVLVLSL